MSESTVTISLNTLLCNRESQSGGSNPYLWPAVVFVDKTTAKVGEIGIAESNAHNVLQHGMKAGDSLTIETTVGQITRYFEDPVSNFVLILTVGMFHADSTPDDSVTAGYTAFQSALQQGVTDHLGELISPDQATVDQAKQEISDAVTAAVTSGDQRQPLSLSEGRSRDRIPDPRQHHRQRVDIVLRRSGHQLQFDDWRSVGRKAALLQGHNTEWHRRRGHAAGDRAGRMAAVPVSVCLR